MRTAVRIAVALVVAGTLAGCSRVPTTIGEPEKLAPPIAGRDGEGRFMQLADYRGQVVLLDFWYTNCPHCRNFEPHEKALLKRYENRPFTILGVNTDPSQETLQKTQRAAQLPWRSWWDGPKGPICSTWGVQGFPTIYLIDHVGRIRYKAEGMPPSEVEKLNQTIARLVQEAEAPR
jgi:cytochrome oxidase Cu insertion factor (SCO1/SenC/PrrC family)